jgi:hypothetical protein
VNVSVTIDGPKGTKEVIQGRVDWTLNHNVAKPSSIFIVIKAKKLGSSLTGLPQLLVYIAAVLKYRSDRVNQSVFGMLSDSGTFQCAFLDKTRKFYTSATFRWALQQSEILSYVDAILLDAIYSSPATTPMRTTNNTKLPTLFKRAMEFRQST